MGYATVGIERFRLTCNKTRFQKESAKAFLEAVGEDSREVPAPGGRGERKSFKAAAG
jgi:hypothetical protein